MNKSKGFTLIELVVVIVILGILAVTAAPKFLNLQDDARTSALQGLQGSINSAANIVYSKAAINGIEQEEEDVISHSSSAIDIAYGYPKATSSGITKALDNFSQDWSIISTAGTTIKIGFKNGNHNNCVSYTQATSIASPTTNVESCSPKA